MSINQVNISGNLTHDPRLRATASGTQVLSFGIAVNDRQKNSRTGEWEDYPNFIDCTMFGTRAESVSRYIRKGSKVAISGKLRYSSWEKDGQKRSKLEVIVNDIEFMSRGDSQQTAYQPPVTPQQTAPEQAAIPIAPAAPVKTVPQSTQDLLYDEFIPF